MLEIPLNVYIPGRKPNPYLSLCIIAGFLLADEQPIMEKHSGRYFLALVWTQNAINIARKEGRIKEEIGAQKLFVVRLCHLLS